MILATRTVCLTLLAGLFCAGPVLAQQAKNASPTLNIERGDVISAATIGALLLILAGVALLGSLFLGAKDPEFTFRHHWGGFGGSSTGWRASTPLMKFVAGTIVCALGVCTLIYILELPDWKPPADSTPSTVRSKPADSPKPAATTPPAAATGT